jgi:hypothetical protein
MMDLFSGGWKHVVERTTTEDTLGSLGAVADISRVKVDVKVKDNDRSII